MYLIDKLHQHGIGVILDFVMGHIIKDSSYLSNFDGTYLYEYEDQFRRENFVWGTANLDFGKGITRSYMRSAFHFYCEYYHVDGFRIDAVSNLLYYLGNKDNGENKEAIHFIQDLTTSLFAKDDTLIFSAEDSTAFNKVTGKVSEGAVGFNYKWNMGYMNDTLKYFALDPIYRKFHHHLLTFASVYNWSENFIMPFSHDEVVHMKGSLINKMPGNYQDKFSQLKLLMLYFYTFPGKKLLFMGGEFGQFDEWHYESALSWSCLRYESHQQYNQYFRDLTKLYLESPQLYALDHERQGFRWIDADDVQRSIYSYLRFGPDEQDPYLVILNMTPVGYEHFGQGVPFDGVWEVIFDGTKTCYYGYGQNMSLPITATSELTVGQPYRMTFDLRPFACLIFRRVHA
jgi:1,4-alpha-glucan branching enzyme